jgi:hypothetical protein
VPKTWIEAEGFEPANPHSAVKAPGRGVEVEFGVVAAHPVHRHPLVRERAAPSRVERIAGG